MRINVYSQELLLDAFDAPTITERPVLELLTENADTGVKYSAIRMFLHSSPRLHCIPNNDDDRSAVTFWLPKSPDRRERLAKHFEIMARMVREAPAETGLD